MSSPATLAESYSDEPYVVITADTHAGASLNTYREYLDPKYRERFDERRLELSQSVQGAHRQEEDQELGQ